MLYGLCSLQSNLCISLHHQSDILWHNGTNCKELLFSSDIWAGYIWQASCHAWLYMSRWPDVVLLLFTRCLYLVGTSDLGTSDCTCQAELMSVHVKLTSDVDWSCSCCWHVILLLLFICMCASMMKNSQQQQDTHEQEQQQ